MYGLTPILLCIHFFSPYIYIYIYIDIYICVCIYIYIYMGEIFFAKRMDHTFGYLGVLGVSGRVKVIGGCLTIQLVEICPFPGSNPSETDRYTLWGTFLAQISADMGQISADLGQISADLGQISPKC